MVIPNLSAFILSRKKTKGCGVIRAVLRTFVFVGVVSAQEVGSIRGMVFDKDFDVPLAAAKVTIAETGRNVKGSDQGNYLISNVSAGSYTLIFSKHGYTRMVQTDVVVTPGQLTEVNAELAGEFTEMEEFIVQDLVLGGSTESGLLNLRAETPALLDSVGADMMSKAGASDAIGALRLVSGASVQDGKYAVVRGLPDRYVNSQMNGVRLPSADPDKRAVQLDQFPTALIESIQVSKTFTPDQQGDASGGAVNIVLKSVPDENVIKFKAGTKYNKQVHGSDSFLSYDNGGVNFTGKDDGGRDPQFDKLGENWDGAVGVSEGDTFFNYDWSLTMGGKKEYDNNFKIGGLAMAYYKRENSHYDDGIDDSYWVLNPGDPLTPKFGQGTPRQGEFVTSLLDVTKSSEEVKWGFMGTVGLEAENHKLSLLYMTTSDTEDSASLAEDTRGKQYYFPGYDLNDPNSPGSEYDEAWAAPWLRKQTLKYTERETSTLQLHGEHKFPITDDLKLGSYFTFQAPEIDWTAAKSFSGLYTPDKRQFGSAWYPVPGYHFYSAHKEAANFTIGNLQRIWKEITEDSEQFFTNAKFPFEQWKGEQGYLKFGLFYDNVQREYDQDSYSNLMDMMQSTTGEWDEYWSDIFSSENHFIRGADIDVDYEGTQKIIASYLMGDLPINHFVNVVGGVRFETTELGVLFQV